MNSVKPQTLSELSPQEWYDLLRDQIKDKALRRHLAKIVWWDYGAQYVSDSPEAKLWGEFHKQFMEFDEEQHFSPEELAEGLRIIGYPNPERRVGITT